MCKCVDVLMCSRSYGEMGAVQKTVSKVSLGAHNVLKIKTLCLCLPALGGDSLLWPSAR